MKQIKIVFFDIDGTLVNPITGRIPDKTIVTLNRLKENGIRICIATGRPIPSLPDFKGVQFDALCTVNGSLCFTNTEILASHPIPHETVLKVMENASSLGRPISVALRDRLAASGYDDDLAEYYRLAGVRLTVAEDFENVIQDDVYQIMLGCRITDHAAIVRDVEGVIITHSWERAADVLSAEGGKANGIRKILDHFQLHPEDALAFGDGQNDADMLQLVGTGVAMGNACAALKALADDVCDAVWDDGIYHWCIQNRII